MLQLSYNCRYWLYQHSADIRKSFDGLFKGYLQTDGYVVYDDYAQREGITLVHCMAHARRKFFEAQKNEAARSTYALEQIQQLYAIERDSKEKNCSAEQKQGHKATGQYLYWNTWANG